MTERRKIPNLSTAAIVFLVLFTLFAAYRAYNTFLVTENRDRFFFDMQLDDEILEGQQYKLVAFAPTERDEDFKSYWATVHVRDDGAVFESVYLYEIGNPIRQGKHYAERVSVSKIEPELYGRQ